MHYELRDCLYVAAGGMLGALARYGVGISARRFTGKDFPWGTLIVNVAGCFAMGMVVATLLAFDSRQSDALTELHARVAFWHKGVAIGFLGGLTTFSSFGAETLRHLSAGQGRLALANVAANVVLSLIAV